MYCVYVKSCVFWKRDTHWWQYHVLCVHSGPLRFWWGTEIHYPPAKVAGSPLPLEEVVPFSSWLWAREGMSEGRVDTSLFTPAVGEAGLPVWGQTFGNTVLPCGCTYVPNPIGHPTCTADGRHLEDSSVSSHSTFERPLRKTCMVWDWESVYYLWWD